MITSIHSIAIKNGKNSSKGDLLSSNKDILQPNDKSITTNESEKNIIKTRNMNSNLNIFNKRSKLDNIDILSDYSYTKRYKNNRNSDNNTINYLNNIKNNNKDNAQILSSMNNFNNIKNIINIKKSISPNNSNTNEILNPRFLNLINSMDLKRNNNVKSPRSIKQLPKITRKVLLTEADTLVKERKKHDGLLAPYIPTNSSLKKHAQINLKNYVIRKIKEKRQEIKDNEKKITEDFKNKKKIYDQRYRNYLDSIEQNQKKQKEEENELHSLRIKLDNQEIELNKEKIENKKLIDTLKKDINSIVTFAKYGSFTNKIFGRQFIYEDLKEFDGKNYNKMMFRFIEIYEKYLFDIKYQKEENEFVEMLQTNGVDFLNMQFSEMEENLRKQLENSNKINEEIVYLSNKNKNEINLLMNRKKQNEKNEKLFKMDKDKQNLLLSGFNGYDIEETKRYLRYIIDFYEIFFKDTNNKKNKKIKESEQIEVNEDALFYGEGVLKVLEEKEKIINKYMIEIENIFKNGNNKEKELVEKIIYQRKKYNIKKKQKELRKIQEEIEMQKKFKTIEENRIVFKGKKVAQNFPLIKNNKKSKHISIKKNNDDLEYLYYSSDEN